MKDRPYTLEIYKPYGLRRVCWRVHCGAFDAVRDGLNAGMIFARDFYADNKRQAEAKARLAFRAWFDEYQIKRGERLCQLLGA